MNDPEAPGEELELTGYRARSMAPEFALSDGTLLRAVDVRGEDDGLGYLYGRFAVFDAWTEVRSQVEGHYLERVAEGAFRKTLSEGRPPIIFNHGWDPAAGTKPLARTEEIGTDQQGGFYGGRLFDTSYNRDIVPGLRAGIYGSSYRFRLTKHDLVARPKPSATNPHGLPEITVREAALREVGPGMFPVYQGTSATVRSETDDVVLARFGLRAEQLDLLRTLPDALTDGADAGHSEAGSRTGAPLNPRPVRFSSDDDWHAYLRRTR